MNTVTFMWQVRSSSLETGAEAFKGIEKEAEDRELGQVGHGSQQAAAGEQIDVLPLACVCRCAGDKTINHLKQSFIWEFDFL